MPEALKLQQGATRTLSFTLGAGVNGDWTGSTLTTTLNYRLKNGSVGDEVWRSEIACGAIADGVVGEATLLASESAALTVGAYWLTLALAVPGDAEDDVWKWDEYPVVLEFAAPTSVAAAGTGVPSNAGGFTTPIKLGPVGTSTSVKLGGPGITFVSYVLEDGDAIRIEDVTGLVSTLSVQSSGIAVNSSSIAVNSSNIAVNSSNVAVNSSNVGVLSGSISVNSSSIATLSGELSTNTAAISSHLANQGVHSLSSLSQSSATDGQIPVWRAALGWVAETSSVVSAWVRNATTGVIYLATSTDKLRIGGDGTANAKFEVVGDGNTASTYTEKLINSSGVVMRETKDDGTTSWRTSGGLRTLTLDHNCNLQFTYPNSGIVSTASFITVLYCSTLGRNGTNARFIASANALTTGLADAQLILDGRNYSDRRNGFTLTGGATPTDYGQVGTCNIYGSSAAPGATVGIVGGALDDSGGDGASGSSGAAHGGRRRIAGGIGYGTGQNGAVCLGVIQTAPRDAEMSNGDISFYVSGSGELIVKYKNASGVTSTSILGTGLTA